ncbi:MAG: UDP-N-acetylmuramate--L-alanine ligase [Clostridia bacterium]|nr:UDP-N-acetylmuramate--L-alanine ligase [Clostridia bacterium]
MALENTHFGYRRIGELLAGCHSIFFIGIGGISMSALAQLSASLGYTVGGSDRSENEQTAVLRHAGIPVYAGHDAANISRYDAVVYTVAIGADNPEYLAAREAGKPLLSRSDYLGYLMVAYRERVGISGMHGKSTCTAMCAQIFLEAADPTVMCGAELPALQHSTCRIGREREHFVFEACEYMDSFLDFNPTLAVVLNIGMDHVDYFKSIEQIRASFLRFAERTGANGTVLYNADDAESVTALTSFAGRHVTFALDGNADFCARNITHVRGVTEFDFYRDGACLCRITLHVFGRHNIYNALAAASAAALCGITPERIAAALEHFSGAHRRMERKGLLNGAAVYDDYGHHPDEIKATLSGAREMGYKRVLCAYQPHTYSRTAGLFEEFAAAFANADRVYLADIYAAREQNIYGVSSELLAGRIGECAEYCGDFSAVADALRRDAHKDDLVIVMGAGDIYKVFDLLGLL